MTARIRSTLLPTSKGHAQQVTSRLAVGRGWRTTDAEEIEQRRRRGREGTFAITPLEPRHRVFGTFAVRSGTARAYTVETRSLEERINSCDCPDYRISGFGTCKHVEAVLARIEHGGASRSARGRSGRVEIFLDQTGGAPAARLRWARTVPPEVGGLLEAFFDSGGSLTADPAAAIPALARRVEALPVEAHGRIRLSRHLLAWADDLARQAARSQAREAHLAELSAGTRQLDLVRHPLHPYQEEGAVFLAFTERALLGDEMGLGKTVQAIAACELLRRVRGVQRVLVICPVSLKAEWEEQIAKFTNLPTRLIAGPRASRLRQYRDPVFFTVTNYEQVVADAADIVRLLAPDVVILDEAQRIKNWRTKTARAVKRLESRYAFVLTGTPLENRIDDLYSIVQFIDPAVFGPLFRFNREFYELDEHGRPTGYRNLTALHERLDTVFLRRRKADVEAQLPARTTNTYFVPMHSEQSTRTAEYVRQVAQLVKRARRRPLSPEEFKRLQGWLACMRMLCDTPYILDPECRVSPKVEELEEILRECLAEDGRKILIFSEWERMLELVRELVIGMEVGFAWHTGSVPQGQRRQEIRRFKQDPSCRLFLSTDAGSVGLNLQAASVVISLDVPWNPARLEQRIARAWRKHQHRSVQVINLISEGTIEHRMLQVLAGKQTLADGLLDGIGELDSLPLPSGRAAFIDRVESIMGTATGAPPGSAAPVSTPPEPEPEPVEPLEQMRRELVAGIGDQLLLLEGHRAPDGRLTLLAVVDRPSEVERRRVELDAIVRRSVGMAGATPSLEILDRATHEAIERLAAAGIVQVVAADRQQLFCSPQVAERRAGLEAQRLVLARQAFDRAERNHRMARVLADGGFALEAVPALTEGLEGARLSLAHLAGAAAAPEERVPSDAIEGLERAEPPIAGLALEIRSLIAQSRAEALSSMTEHDATSLVAAGTGVMRQIERILGGRATETT
jgi:superfamily II DNA or RNA helicase